MMHHPLRFAILAALALLLPVAPPAVLAQGQTAAAGQQADLGRIEAYLNGITTAAADFTQTAPNGAMSRGALMISRPGRLRFDYSDPKGDLIVADGDYIIYWDAKLQQMSDAPISSIPGAKFFLQPHISLSQGVRVTRFEHAAGMIRVTLVQADDPDAGALTVVLADQPLALKSWTVVDGQGQRTEVALSDLRLGASVDPALFHFKEPGSGKRHR
jgi:outer membrane lipoprotein-sorting protein